jgi:peptidoglycan/xylan/chitin deacetylase (PgdA/CDA1 family)
MKKPLFLCHPDQAGRVLDAVALIRIWKESMKRILPALMVFFLLTGCSVPNVMALFATQTPTPTVTPTATATFTPSPTPTLTLTPTVTATFVPTATATPVFIVKGPGSIICPILLYHRIQVVPPPVPAVAIETFSAPDDFRAQMQALKDWGYTPIPISLLVKAINFGAPLPEKPVVITFDDNDITVYTTAFPIMKEFGFVGVNYLVGNRLGSDGFMSIDQIKELIDAGWEVGSHSMTHTDLTQSPSVDWELTQSQAKLQDALGVKVETFAYPFGTYTDDLLHQVGKIYAAGMGLGVFLEQTPNNIDYLWRRPVPNGVDLATFASYFPQSTPPAP